MTFKDRSSGVKPQLGSTVIAPQLMELELLKPAEDLSPILRTFLKNMMIVYHTNIIILGGNYRFMMLAEPLKRIAALYLF